MFLSTIRIYLVEYLLCQYVIPGAAKLYSVFLLFFWMLFFLTTENVRHLTLSKIRRIL